MYGVFFYVFQGDFCSLAGFMLICKASSTSSSWHNFVSDDDHWMDENGETPCINSGGMYALASFMDPMIENGAKNIWSNVKSPTLFGSPKLSAGNFFQNFLKPILSRRAKSFLFLFVKQILPLLCTKHTT